MLALTAQQSERAFLQNISRFHKKIIVIISKIDLLESDDELHDVRNFVMKNFRDHLGIEPQIFEVSSKLALRAKLERNKGWNMRSTALRCDVLRCSALRLIQRADSERRRAQRKREMEAKSIRTLGGLYLQAARCRPTCNAQAEQSDWRCRAFGEEVPR